MNNLKKILGAIGFMVFLWFGMYFALIAEITQDKSMWPFKDDSMFGLVAAILFFIAVLFLGYSNSIPWKKKR